MIFVTFLFSTLPIYLWTWHRILDIGTKLLRTGHCLWTLAKWLGSGHWPRVLTSDIFQVQWYLTLDISIKLPRSGHSQGTWLWTLEPGPRNWPSGYCSRYLALNNEHKFNFGLLFNQPYAPTIFATCGKRVLVSNGPYISTFQTILKNVCLSVILKFCLSVCRDWQRIWKLVT